MLELLNAPHEAINSFIKTFQGSNAPPIQKLRTMPRVLDLTPLGADPSEPTEEAYQNLARSQEVVGEVTGAYTPEKQGSVIPALLGATAAAAPLFMSPSGALLNTLARGALGFALGSGAAQTILNQTDPVTYGKFSDEEVIGNVNPLASSAYRFFTDPLNFVGAAYGAKVGANLANARAARRAAAAAAGQTEAAPMAIPVAGTTAPGAAPMAIPVAGTTAPGAAPTAIPVAGTTAPGAAAPAAATITATNPGAFSLPEDIAQIINSMPPAQKAKALEALEQLTHEVPRQLYFDLLRSGTNVNMKTPLIVQRAASAAQEKLQRLAEESLKAATAQKSPLAVALETGEIGVHPSLFATPLPEGAAARTVRVPREISDILSRLGYVGPASGQGGGQSTSNLLTGNLPDWLGIRGGWLTTKNAPVAMPFDPGLIRKLSPDDLAPEARERLAKIFARAMGLQVD